MMKKVGVKVLTVLPPALARQLRLESAYRNIPMCDMIASAVTTFLAEHGHRQIGELMSDADVPNDAA